MARRFQNQGKVLQSFYVPGRTGYHHFATHLKPGAVIEAKSDREALFWSRQVKRGIGIIEIEPNPDPPKPVRQLPRRFRNESKQMQRYFPAGREHSWNDNVDIPVGATVVASTEQEAQLLARIGLLEVVDDEV